MSRSINQWINQSVYQSIIIIPKKCMSLKWSASFYSILSVVTIRAWNWYVVTWSILIDQSINQLTSQSIRQSIMHQSRIQSFTQSINQLTSQLIVNQSLIQLCNQSINHSENQSDNPPTSQSVSQSINIQSFDKPIN